MTFAEEMLISLILPEMVVCRLMIGGQRGYSGHAISFPRDLRDWVATELPRAASDIEVIVVRQHGRQGVFKDYTVRRDKVRIALIWLKLNNPHYRDIPINHAHMNALPINGPIYLNEVDHKQIEATHEQQPEYGSHHAVRVRSAGSYLYGSYPCP
eukprot:GHVR01080176.1.p2 GENE.GHVR01080176.1~~GHVR01080176.1.p2  ORF type:complete len:155 (-),score=19.50 GHVR01080176.1:448-912(-)